MRLHWLALCTFIVAFCSIIYELVLAQCLSIVLGNTVLRYSVTIGLYLFSLGMGALLFAYEKRNQTPQLLFFIEAILAFVGLVLPFLVLGGDQFIRQFLQAWDLSPNSFLYTLPSWIFMHSVIILIGLMSGAELPILMELARKEAGDDRAAQRILAIDYLGTFVGALAFPLFIYEKLGLVAGSVLVGALNALVALLTLFLYSEYKSSFRFFLCFSFFVISCVMMQEEASLRHALVHYVFG